MNSYNDGLNSSDYYSNSDNDHLQYMEQIAAKILII